MPIPRAAYTESKLAQRAFCKRPWLGSRQHPGPSSTSPLFQPPHGQLGPPGRDQASRRPGPKSGHMRLREQPPCCSHTWAWVAEPGHVRGAVLTPTQPRDSQTPGHFSKPKARVHPARRAQARPSAPSLAGPLCSVPGASSAPSTPADSEPVREGTILTHPGAS